MLLQTEQGMLARTFRAVDAAGLLLEETPLQDMSHQSTARLVSVEASVEVISLGAFLLLFTQG